MSNNNNSNNSIGVQTRLLGYAWMFTGAVHLCTLLHYAPADPPAALTKYLMMLTGIIPLSIGVAYVIVRTIYEPSPLNLLFKGPYYYVTSNYESLDKLWAVELNCWIEPSESELIEGIPNYPNVVLILVSLGDQKLASLVPESIARGATQPRDHQCKITDHESSCRRLNGTR